MKKLFIIVFLLVIFIGLIGYTGKVENESLEASGVVSQAFSSDVLVNNSKESIRMDQQQLLTLILLFGAGLVGLLIIRRKWSLFNALLINNTFHKPPRKIIDWRKGKTIYKFSKFCLAISTSDLPSMSLTLLFKTFSLASRRMTLTYCSRAFSILLVFW